LEEAEGVKRRHRGLKRTANFKILSSIYQLLRASQELVCSKWTADFWLYRELSEPPRSRSTHWALL